MLPSAKHQFRALDGLRGILALLVALFHLPLLGHLYDTSVVRHGELAVDFFFVLSGFVITHASMAQLTSWQGGVGFAIRRFGRIWPLHVVVLGAFVLNEFAKLIATHGTGIQGEFAAFANSNTTSLVSIPSHLLLIQSLGIHDKYTWNGPSWSISTEFYTYLLFALLVLCVPRRWLAAVVAAIALGSGLLFYFISPEWSVPYRTGIFRCMAGFFTGHLVYRLWQSRPQRALPHATLAEAAAIIAILVFPTLPGLSQFSVFTPICVALAVWVFAYQQGSFSKLLTTRPLQTLGLLSYSIYMVHSFIILVIKRALFMYERVTHQTFHYDFRSKWSPHDELVFDFGNPWVMDLLTLLYVLVVIGVAALATRYVENPGRRFFNRLANKWTSHAR